MEFNPLRHLQKKENQPRSKVATAALALTIALASVYEKPRNNHSNTIDIKNKSVAEESIGQQSPEEIERGLAFIETGEEEFKKLVNYIKKHGEFHDDVGGPLKQLSFSIKENRHSYIYNLDSTVVRDVVFTKDDYMVYVIDAESARPYVDKNGVYKNNKKVREEIKQFLEKINR